MDTFRSKIPTTRVFGKPITNQSVNVAGHVAGAEKSNVELNEVIRKRGSNEAVNNVPKKMKSNLENQGTNLKPGKEGKDLKPGKEGTNLKPGKEGKDQGVKAEAKKVSQGKETVQATRVSMIPLTTSQVNSGVSIAGQCLLTEPNGRKLDRSEDESVRRSTRSSLSKGSGILSQIIKLTSGVEPSPVMKLPIVEPTPGCRISKGTGSQLVPGPLKPSRRSCLPTPVVLTPFRDLLLRRPSIDFTDPSSYYQGPWGLPRDMDDFDKTQVADACSEPHYADSVFKYYKHLESKHFLPDYMIKQKQVSKAMRSVLVDWMVEVQESFELNHETLYLGVKLVDHYLSKVVIAKDKFQLLGATCLFIAAKFDERIPPSIEDFLYICDDAYLRKDLISFEMEVLKKLDFFVGFAISYRFLRRYARVAKLTMEQLTLARYILEMSLMDYEVTCLEMDSKVAAASLLLALRMKGLTWTSQLEFYSGYEQTDLSPLMVKLNQIISCPIKTNKTVKQKYSHKIFFEVAKIPPVLLTTSGK